MKNYSTSLLNHVGIIVLLLSQQDFFAFLHYRAALPILTVPDWSYNLLFADVLFDKSFEKRVCAPPPTLGEATAGPPVYHRKNQTNEKFRYHLTEPAARVSNPNVLAIVRSQH
ncbi:MAG: hypothetical protein ABI296_01890 [Gammaproteobacteria bacterium]